MRAPLDDDVLAAALDASKADAGATPWRVDVRRSVGSTNAEAARAATAWLAVCADEQTAGRGRQARRWEAPADSSVAVSAVLPLAERDGGPLGWLPLLAGMAMAGSVRALTSLDPRLKWPNDLLLPEAPGQWRKVGGVLCELLPGQRLVVAGVGLNVDQSREELPVPGATSLALCGAGPVHREELVAAFLQRLASLHPVWSAGTAAFGALREDYRRQCLTLGQQVRLDRPDGSAVTGRALAVDDDGRLVVESAAAATTWSAGDVTHLRPVAATTAATGVSAATAAAAATGRR